MSTIYSIVRAHGGIAPRCRVRGSRSLSQVERETISRGLSAGLSLRSIARTLHRAPSTISREITRHGGPIRYRAVEADVHAWRRAKRPKVSKLVRVPLLRAVVDAKLRLNWSPAQISGWLVSEHPEARDMHVSHETIYRSLFVQARGSLKRALTAHLRTRRRFRRSKRGQTTEDVRERIVDAVSIAERPTTVEDRAIPGHWEGDLLSGSNNSHIATLVERRSRYVHLVRVAGKDTTWVVNALIREVAFPLGSWPR